jgi:hypothetical protein
MFSFQYLVELFTVYLLIYLITFTFSNHTCTNITTNDVSQWFSITGTLYGTMTLGLFHRDLKHDKN